MRNGQSQSPSQVSKKKILAQLYRFRVKKCTWGGYRGGKRYSLMTKRSPVTRSCDYGITIRVYRGGRTFETAVQRGNLKKIVFKGSRLDFIGESINYLKRVFD